MILCAAAACVCLAAACVSGWAQTTPTLKEVVVTATRVDSSVLDSPSSVSVISAGQIADSGATDVAQVISGQPGVVVNDYGTAGATKNVSIRGSTSSQVLVLLDGVRLNSSQNGGVDLSSVPLEIIDHIEIVRGGESSLYGSSAIGGVINIITKKADTPSISLSITNGSYIPHPASSVSEVYQAYPPPPLYPQTPVAANPMDLLDSQNVNLSMSGKLGSVGLTGGGSFARAANSYTWNDTLGINGVRRMTNADTLSGSGYAGADAPVLGGQLALKGVLVTSDTGVPGSLTTISQTARQTDTSASGSLAWKTDRFFTDALTLDFKSFYRYEELGYNDPTYPPASLHRTQSAVGDLTQRLTLSDAVSITYGGNVSSDIVDSTNFAGPKHRLNLAGFLSVPVSPVEQLTITPSVRYDYFSDFAGNLSYSLSAVLLLSDQSSLRASFATAYRVPTLNDLYWYDPTGFTAANPGLTPETSYNGEVGWSLIMQNASFDATVFTRLVRNNIIWLSAPPAYVYMPENLYETLFPGAEVHGKLMIIGQISLEASYTFLYSLLLNDGTTALTLADNLRVPYSPMHAVNARARYKGKSFELGVDLHYLSRQFTDTANTRAASIPGYFLANADCRFITSENTAFTVALKNIFNVLYYTQLGYPMPPFSLVTGVSLTL
jgi:vitamin B12 transporter